MSISTHSYSCNGCGGMQKYSPKSHALECVFCGTEVKIAEDKVTKEHDYRHAISEKKAEQEAITQEIKCTKCAASFTLNPHCFASECPYCDTPTLIECTQAFKPDGVVPFLITRKEAKETFSKWVKSRWFAPSAFSKYFSDNKILLGNYLPHWTYDTDTVTDYQGQRGDAYYISVTKTVIEEGRSVQKEVQERRIDWSYASGVVSVSFDDVIVPSSPKISSSLLHALEPWETKDAESFDSQYIAGFEAEEYTMGLEEGFTFAKGKMASKIRSTIHRDIGGDEQRISSQNTDYRDISYKNILLPIWTAFFTWKEKEYHYAINAQTGELVGERPYSVTKIVFTLIAITVIIVGIIYFEGLKMWFLGM